MNARKFSRILMLGGAAVFVLSVVWFFAAYAEAIDYMGQYGGGDMVAETMACLYSSPAICQGAGALGDAPSYSPVVFWIGLIAFLAGVAVRFALDKPVLSSGSANISAAGDAPRALDAGDRIMGVIPRQKYAKNAYILFLIGAAGGLLLPPVMIVGLIGLVLSLLGVLVFRPQLSELDIAHLAALSATFVVASIALLVTRGSFFFLLVALAQIALYYIGFNSHRHGRVIGIGSLKDEALAALKPATQRISGREP